MAYVWLAVGFQAITLNFMALKTTWRLGKSSTTAMPYNFTRKQWKQNKKSTPTHPPQHPWDFSTFILDGLATVLKSQTTTSECFQKPQEIMGFQRPNLPTSTGEFARFLNHQHMATLRSPAKSETFIGLPCKIPLKSKGGSGNKAITLRCAKNSMAKVHDVSPPYSLFSLKARVLVF